METILLVVGVCYVFLIGIWTGQALTEKKYRNQN
jgi:uncharacterized membrane protein YiaA